MASTIASLFGPSAEQIVYDRQKEERDRKSLQYQQTLTGLRDTPGAATGYALGYQSGQGLSSAVRGFQSGEGTQGKILGGLFGQSEQLEDPRLAKSIQSRQIMSDVGIEDLNDAGQLSILAQRFSKAGMPEAALYFSDREKEVKKYNLDLATALDPVLTEGVVTKDGRVVGRNKYNQYFTLDDMKRVDQGSLQSVRLYEKQISAGADEPAVASIVAIENSFLADTDFDKQTKDRVAKYLNQKAELIVREPGFDTKEQALDEAYKRAIKEGVIVNEAFPITYGDKVLFTTESLGGAAGLGRQDWKFRPEGTGTVLKPGFRIVAED